MPSYIINLTYEREKQVLMSINTLKATWDRKYALRIFNQCTCMLPWISSLLLMKRPKIFSLVIFVLNDNWQNRPHVFSLNFIHNSAFVSILHFLLFLGIIMLLFSVFRFVTWIGFGLDNPWVLSFVRFVFGYNISPTFIYHSLSNSRSVWV